MSKKVIAGEKFSITANTFNSFIDAADAHKNSSKTKPNRNQSKKEETILIKNNSGSDIVRYGVLGIDGVNYDFTANPEEFLNNASLKGITPTADHLTSFVVTQEPIKIGEIGRCRVVGVTVAMVNIITEGDTTCGADTSITDLKSGSGGCDILYAPSGTGVKACLIRFGGGGGNEVKRVKHMQTLPTGNATTVTVWSVDLSGQPFPAYVAASKSAVDLAMHTPDIITGNILFVRKIGEDWYLDPPLLELEDCEE